MIRFGIFTASLASALALALPASAATFTFTATLDGASERPDAVATSGTGSATVTLDDAADTVSWTINYQNLSSAIISAHFHCPADASTAAGVRITIPIPDAGATSPLTGSATAVSQDIQNELLGGFCYINIHTQNNQGGEIRGLVVRQLDGGTTDGGDASPDSSPDSSPDAPGDAPADRTDAPTDAPADRDSAGGTAGSAGSAGRGGTGGSTAGTGGGGTGGRGGSAGTGGGGSSGRGGTSGRGGSGSSAPPGDDDDGCGCRTVGDSGSAAGLIGLALAGLMLSRRMAERRSRRENERK